MGKGKSILVLPGQALLTPACVDYVYAVTPLLEDALTDRTSTPNAFPVQLVPKCTDRENVKVTKSTARLRLQ